MVTSSVPPTVKGFLTILVGRLTQYDKKLQARQPNIYRLGLLFAAKEKVEARVNRYLDDSTPGALNALKVALTQEFLVNDMPPVKAVMKMIDEYLANGKAPKYSSVDRVISRFLGVEPVIKVADATDSLVSVQDALKDNDAAALKKALGALNGLAAGRALAVAMKRTATKPADVVKLLGDIH